jgi:hypothetical protein
MPLDRINGEMIPAFGQHDLPIPANGKWRETPWFDFARREAIKVFMKEAKLNRSSIKARIDDDDWFAQTYAKQGRMVFFFQKLIPIRKSRAFSTAVIEERFHWTVVTFLPDELRELTMMGLWPFVPEMVLIGASDNRRFMTGSGTILDANPAAQNDNAGPKRGLILP